MACIRADFERIDAQTFCEVVDARCGSAVARQARQVFCEGGPLEDQNPNALLWIADIAALKGERAITEELRQFVKNQEAEEMADSATVAEFEKEGK